MSSLILGRYHYWRQVYNCVTRVKMVRRHKNCVDTVFAMLLHLFIFMEAMKYDE